MSYQKTEPKFISIASIKPGKHCYNIYGRVIKAELTEEANNKGEKHSILRGVIADESGCADFKFVGDNATEVKQGCTIAIRNGKSNVVNEHIQLEVDRFGKVTIESDDKVNSVNTENNISSAVWEKKVAKKD